MQATVRTHVSEEHSFELVTRVPDRRLHGLIGDYQDFRERSAAPLTRTEIASPDVVVIVDLGDGWSIGAEHHRSFAGGLTDAPVRVGHTGTARAVQVDLTPLGARALLGVPLAELTRRVVGLDDLLGPEAGRLAERLHDAPGPDERFALLDRVLLERVAACPSPRPDVAWAWRRLTQSAGAVRIEDLARELGCSRRHLTGRFAQEIGLPPKTVARLLRFRRAAEALLSGGEEGLARIASACGYADQSHLNREFRAFTGTTPTALLRARLPAGGGLGA